MWENVTSTTINNCWQKANILPTYGEGSDDENDEIREDRNYREDNIDVLLELERCYQMKIMIV